MKKIIFSIVLSLLWVDPILSAGQTVIRFATEATYPPFESVNARGQIEGFDIDIARALCVKIKASCTFTNQSFDSLIQSVNMGKFDAVIASLSITRERQQQVDFTISYYVPKARFVARRYNRIMMLIGQPIGVQQGSTFAQYLHEQYDDQVQIKTYASMQDAFLDLTLGRTDAVLADAAIVQAWLRQSDHQNQFSVVDQPVVDDRYFGQGYGIAVRKGNQPLLRALNQALIAIKADGTYDKIVKKYFGQTTVLEYHGHGFFLQILEGALMTIKLAVCAALLGMVLGLIVAGCESSSVRWVRYLVRGMVLVVRSLPELLVLFFMYFGLTTILSRLLQRDVNVSTFFAGVTALGLIFSAYASQVFRGAFMAIDEGQVDAGMAIGFNRWQVFMHIQLPQAWRHAIPGLGNLWLVLLKDTALVALIGLTDLMYRAKIAASSTQQPFTYYLFAAFLYLAITSASQKVIHYASLHFNCYLNERCGY
jgi:lysine-arginine-ornithine-binding protein